MEVKGGHFEIKEFHFHIYWLQNNGQAEKRALAFKEELIEQVKQNRFIVVCDGIDEKILPALKSPVPKVNRGPIGPHPCGSYEVGCLESNLNFLKIEFLSLRITGLVPSRVSCLNAIFHHASSRNSEQKIKRTNLNHTFRQVCTLYVGVQR